ncbi:hypothetical protein NPIL_688431 [Nephila pilipes]|uniref:Uncharacterized protein n=1 Tax=Nephila pilipes TaxID=299642 RepID=A0A8X6MA98_NEPPI|nr:hypothetical protein NPIL_688431 [Nephila pilipes]
MRVWGETLEARTDPRNLLNPWKIRNKNPWDALGKGETGSIGERDTEGETWTEEERQKKSDDHQSKKRTQSDKINRKHEVKEATCAKKETKIL